VGFGLVVVALLVYDGSIVRIPRFFNYPVVTEPELTKADSVEESTSTSD
jgi:hypothetical protein